MTKDHTSVPAGGAILGPATNLKAFKELKPLPHDDSDDDSLERVDPEKWFEDFEDACWRGHGSGPVSQLWWLDQLLLQATPHARHHINSILQTLSHDSPQLDRFQQYVEVRDSLLLEQPGRYSAVAYHEQLMSLKPGERKALALQRHIRRLWTPYEAARVRDAKAKPPKEMPTLPEFFITLLYSKALKPTTRAGIPLLSVFVSEGSKQLLMRYAQRAAAFEAANPPVVNYVVAAAMETRRIDGEQTEKFLKQQRKCVLGDGDLLEPPAKRSAGESQRMQQQVMTAILQLVGKGQLAAPETPVRRRASHPWRTDRRQAADGGFCFHCHSPDHNLVGCQWWHDYVGRDNTRRTSCPKCLQHGHSCFACPQATGVMWACGPGPSIPGKEKKPVQAVAAGIVPATQPARNSNEGRFPGPEEAEKDLLFDGSLSPKEESDTRACTTGSMLYPEVSEPQVCSAESQSQQPRAHLAVSPRLCAALVLPYVPGGNLFVPLTFLGRTFQALLDPGSAVTLLSNKYFPPDTLPGYAAGITPSTQLLDASAQKLLTTGSCAMLIQAGTRCAAVTVTSAKKLPAPALIGLDAINALGVSILSAGGEFRVVVGGEAKEAVDSFVLRPLQAVSTLRASKRNTDEHESERAPGGAKAEVGLVLEAPLQRDADDAMCMRMVCSAAVHVSGAWVVPESRLEAMERIAHVCSVGQSSCDVTQEVVNNPQTKTEVKKRMCERTEGLKDIEVQALKQLCLRYEKIWNAGDKPLAKTNLTTFKVELQEGALPIDCGYRAVSAEKRQRIARLVNQCLCQHDALRRVLYFLSFVGTFIFFLGLEPFSYFSCL